MRWCERDGVRWLEAELPRGRAAFTARVGGVSGQPFDSLNLGVLTGDDLDAVRTNRHRAAAALRLDPERVLIGRQVHRAEIARHDGPQRPNAYAEPGPDLPEVDAQATGQPRLAPVVLVADCLPVAVSGPGGVAMVHCGWRGLAAGIAERAAKEVAADAAAIGPGIGPCCYEVGEEVMAAVSATAQAPSTAEGAPSKRTLDLRAVAVRGLRSAGVERIEVSELCTSCNPDLFYSHRRDGERTGRQAGFAWLD